jgi:hypothetical protein
MTEVWINKLIIKTTIKEKPIMLKRISIIFSTLILSMSFLTSQIFACACCAEPGTYHNWQGKIDDYNLELLSEMKFANQSDLYMTEAGWEMVKGLDPIVKNYPFESWATAPLFFNSTHSFMQLKDQNFSISYWKLNFITKHKKLSGSMILPVPGKMSQFKVDIHDKKDGGAGSPLLYKEWRFSGKVKSATGFFMEGIDESTEYQLIFQGRGNGCDNADDFTHWLLIVKGDKAEYQYSGKMSSAFKKDTVELKTSDSN